MEVDDEDWRYCRYAWRSGGLAKSNGKNLSRCGYDYSRRRSIQLRAEESYARGLCSRGISRGDERVRNSPGGGAREL